MTSLLARFGLWFNDPADERAFLEVLALQQRGWTQGGLLLAGIVFYVFFIWDEIIDPKGAQFAHLIRGVVVTPLIFLSALLLFIRGLDRWFEAIVIFASVSATIGLAVIYSILKNGFDYGAVGIVLLLFYTFSLAPVRSPFLAMFCVFAWGLFDSFNLAVGFSRFGMFIVNNLSIGTAAVAGIYATVVREHSMRQQFLAKKALQIAREQVGDLQQSNRFLQDQARRLISARASSIIISYRRADSEAISGRIRDRLVAHFGEKAIFMDVDSIPLGLDFRRQIELVMLDAEIFLAVIGPQWVGITNTGKARISDIADPVRIEVEFALQRAIPLIPLLVAGAKMPDASVLPDCLRDLSFRNAIEIDSGADFHSQMDRLIRSIDRILEVRRAPSSSASSKGGPHSPQSPQRT